MQFYGYFRSSAAYRCRIAFNLKGIAPETVHVHLRKGEQRQAEYLARNPHGLVPALEKDGHLLTQSLAIIEWLEETYPAPRLLPVDALDRAYVRSLALSIACDIHPLQNLRVLNHVRDAFGQDQAGMFSWARHFVAMGLANLEAQINAASTAGQFCFGDTPGLADICLVPQMYSAQRFNVDVSALTTLNRIRARCDALPTFQHAHPEQQSDFEV